MTPPPSLPMELLKKDTVPKNVYNKMIIKNALCMVWSLLLYKGYPASSWNFIPSQKFKSSIGKMGWGCNPV